MCSKEFEEFPNVFNWSKRFLCSFLFNWWQFFFQLIESNYFCWNFCLPLLNGYWAVLHTVTMRIHSLPRVPPRLQVCVNHYQIHTRNKRSIDLSKSVEVHANSIHWNKLSIIIAANWNQFRKMFRCDPLHICITDKIGKFGIVFTYLNNNYIQICAVCRVVFRAWTDIICCYC